MNVPFDVTVTLTAGAGTALLNVANNALAVAGTETNRNTTLLQGKHWLTDIALAADTACVVQYGYCAADKSGFVPVYTVVSTSVGGSGWVRHMNDGVEVLADGTALFPAIKVTVGGVAATARVSGDLGFWKRLGDA